MGIIKDLFKGIHEEFGWFIWGLIGLGMIWFFTGGTENPEAHQGPYLKPPAPLNTGEAYGGAYLITDKPKQTLDLPTAPATVVKDIEETIVDFVSQAQEAANVHSQSLVSQSVYLDGVAGAKEVDPQKEYIRIVASTDAKRSTNLSEMNLRGTGYSVRLSIPQATDIPLLGTPYTKTDVILPPAGRALISTGRSPIGTSFRVNICSGYLNQFQTFTPDLRQDCPDPLAELARSGPYTELSCRTFVSALPRCRAYGGNFPSDLSTARKAFVTNELNYNSCVATHKTETNFKKDEWRLFLEQSQELWKNKREIIKLLDNTGGTADALTY